MPLPLAIDALFEHEFCKMGDEECTAARCDAINRRRQVRFSMTRQTIVIGGAGFCGGVLAANLLRRPPADPTEIVLIERGPAIGPGLAYAAHDVPYVLNVPAGRLSADSQDPLQFLRFVRQLYPDADAEDFMPRALYGDYLQDVLDQAERSAPAHVELTRVFGEVTGITAGTGGKPLSVNFAERDSIAADRVVLALGNPPPPVQSWARGVRHHPAYFHDPWNMPATFHAKQSVLIVGNGLTMVDVALALSLEGGQVPLVRTISRHGLIPQSQTIFSPTAVQGSGEILLSNATSIRRVLSASRALAREVLRLGGDWREVVTFIRHLAPNLWEQLPGSERRRFVRHVQCYWDVHRHRLPPSMAARIEHMRRSGRLEINAGRIQQLIPEGEELRVVWRRRGTTETRTFAANAVINATGPDYVLKRSSDPLLQSLRAAGWVSEDDLDLGLRTAKNGAVVSADGAPNAHLYYLGPMLRADHWEATAATELRTHAERLAGHLAGRDHAPGH
jgi:uncharacterized NAD(P)/FAD-binding protein YdhS